MRNLTHVDKNPDSAMVKGDTSYRMLQAGRTQDRGRSHGSCPEPSIDSFPHLILEDAAHGSFLEQGVHPKP